MSDETRELYASDVAWSTLLPALADAAVETEAQRRTYLRGFNPEPTQPLSLSALRPRKDDMVFHLREGSALDLDVALDSLADGDVIYQGTDPDGRLAVVVTEHPDRPAWISSDTLDGLRYELHVAVLDQSRRYLFVHGTRDTSITAFVEHLGESDPVLIDPLWLDRLMIGLKLVSYFSVGMRSTRAAGGRLAAYRMMAGTNVGPAVSRSEARSYGSGHAIAQVRDPMVGLAHNAETRVTSVGVSFGRAKVFSPDHAHLLDFRAWCDRLAELVEHAAGASPTGLPGLPLRSPRSITEFPEQPYLITLDPDLLGKGLLIIGALPDSVVELERVELAVDRSSPTCLTVTAWISDGMIWCGTLSTDGHVRSEDAGVLVQDPSETDAAHMADFLSHNAPSIFFANGTTTIGRSLFHPQDEYPDLLPEEVRSFPFLADDVDITKESQNAPAGKINIKTYMTGRYSGQPDVEFVIDDDRAHEIADLIVVGKLASNGSRQVNLVHLKFSSKPYPGARVEDMYEVLGQAGRSVAKLLRPDRLASRLSQRLANGSTVPFGDRTQLDRLLTQWALSPGPIMFTVTVVQPGLTRAAVIEPGNIKIMLSDVAEWVNQHDAQFKIVTHE